MITGIGGLFALVEVVYLLLIIFGNHANGFYNFIRSIGEPLALFFPGLFPISNFDLAVVVNYGLAALFWLVVTQFVARLVDR